MDATKKSVLIMVPTETWIHHKVVVALCQILQTNKKYEVNTAISSQKDIGAHRNHLVKTFLDTKYEWLLMIDSDNPPPPNVLSLIEEDKPVIGLPTPINMNWTPKVNDFLWNVYEDDRLNVLTKGEGLQKVHSVGSGCMLIRRDVLEKIKNPFTTVRDEGDYRTVGTDMAFCYKCIEAGIEIYTHWDFVCDHYKEINLKTLI